MNKQAIRRFLLMGIFLIIGVFIVYFAAMFLIDKASRPTGVAIPPSTDATSATTSQNSGGSSDSSSGVASSSAAVPSSSSVPEAVPVPDPVVTLSLAEIYPGESAVVQITNLPTGYTAEISGKAQATPVYTNGDGHIALVAVSYFSTAGSYPVTVTIVDHKGQPFKTYELPLTVQEKLFDTQNLVVDQTITDSTYANKAANDELAEKLLPLKTISDDQKHWSGAFVMPCEAWISTTFGTIRYVNGQETSEQHGGMDIAAALGTPVLAPNGGRVLFADFLQLTGYTILIEHGYGLKTYYYHMNSLDVAAGDMVAKGQKLGEVGSTGFSTGAHLHYAMSVNTVFIDPHTTWEAFG